MAVGGLASPSPLLEGKWRVAAVFLPRGRRWRDGSVLVAFGRTTVEVLAARAHFAGAIFEEQLYGWRRCSAVTPRAPLTRGQVLISLTGAVIVPYLRSKAHGWLAALALAPAGDEEDEDSDDGASWQDGGADDDSDAAPVVAGGEAIPGAAAAAVQPLQPLAGALLAAAISAQEIELATMRHLGSPATAATAPAGDAAAAAVTAAGRPPSPLQAVAADAARGGFALPHAPSATVSAAAATPVATNHLPVQAAPPAEAAAAPALAGLLPVWLQALVARRLQHRWQRQLGVVVVSDAVATAVARHLATLGSRLLQVAKARAAALATPAGSMSAALWMHDALSLVYTLAFGTGISSFPTVWHHLAGVVLGRRQPQASQPQPSASTTPVAAASAGDTLAGRLAAVLRVSVLVLLAALKAHSWWAQRREANARVARARAHRLTGAAGTGLAPRSSDGGDGRCITVLPTAAPPAVEVPPPPPPPALQAAMAVAGCRSSSGRSASLDLSAAATGAAAAAAAGAASLAVSGSPPLASPAFSAQHMHQQQPHGPDGLPLVPLPRTGDTCPLCCGGLVAPVALPSGVVYCARCLQFAMDQQRRRGQEASPASTSGRHAATWAAAGTGCATFCPVTGIPCAPESARKLFL